MKPTHAALLAAITIVLAGGCAPDSAVSESRKALHEGRGEDALQVLERAAKEAPDDRVARQEYFRLRERLAAQWLAQAETLRASGELEAAESLYRRVQRYDPAGARRGAPQARLGQADLARAARRDGAQHVRGPAARHRRELRVRQGRARRPRSEEHTSELQSPCNLVC